VTDGSKVAKATKIDLIRALEVFLAVADSGSMTTAGRTLKITQSAISQQLKLLETEMRATLMDRNTRPLRLTPAGNALRDHAVEIIQRADQARAEIQHLAAGSMPHLRVAMFDTLAKTLVPALVEAVVRRALPITTLSVLRGMAAQHARELPRRDVDIVITSNPLIDVEGMERHELIRERFLLVVAKGELPRQQSLREIAARLPLIRYSARTEAGRMIEQHLRRQRIDVAPGHAFDAPEDLFTMVGSARGWAVTAPTHVVHAFTPATTELRPMPRPELSRSIVLVARKGELGDIPRRIADLCRRALRERHLPQVRALMPALADHLTVVDEPAQSDDSQ
jgi:DNA-binding transcriptional LysR family regulator